MNYFVNLTSSEAQPVLSVKHCNLVMQPNHAECKFTCIAVFPWNYSNFGKLNRLHDLININDVRDKKRIHHVRCPHLHCKLYKSCIQYILNIIFHSNWFKHRGNTNYPEVLGLATAVDVHVSINCITKEQFVIDSPYLFQH